MRERIDVYNYNDVAYISSNFKPKEFDCTIATPYTFISPKLILLLQDIRNLLQIPMEITSGYRTPEYNSTIGGHIHSYHQAGMAADWKLPKGYNTVILFEKLLVKPVEDIFSLLGGIGFYRDRNFIHVDVQNRIDGKVKVWYG